MKKVELLAPAGNYECLQAAVNAGADAIYLGGSKFGARAFADNFTTEELIQGIHYAHLFGVKIFLTVNTLVKEKEFDELYDYILPLYTAGLDAVIVQDIGVFQYLKKCFPSMELHASTQMTLTGVAGAKLLKEMGASRIVPARELSLKEIRAISEAVDIDIECFIHGAMCYSYSGQCLFSSILGGRSGNRGRCAGPCRLPYSVDQSFASNICISEKQADYKKIAKSQNKQDAGRGKANKKGNASHSNLRIGKETVKGNYKKEEQYPLSLKDMCTIEYVGDLIEAGITSFKIEGRMKSPEYVAGVVSIYRKYIDLYYQNGKASKVDSQDLELLNHLYIRSNRHEGYYFKHNGPQMVTLSSPAYAGNDENKMKEIRERYLSFVKRAKVDASFHCLPGEPMVFSIQIPNQNIYVTVTGAVAEFAQNRAMTKADFEKQLSKTKDTFFEIDHFTFEIGEQVFVPLKEVNALRREAFEQVTKEMFLLDSKNRMDANKACRNSYDIGEHGDKAKFTQQLSEDEYRCEHHFSKKQGNTESATLLSALVLTQEQFTEVQSFDLVKRIYIDFDLALTLDQFTKREDCEHYLALPFIYRMRSQILFEQLSNLLTTKIYDGVLVRNLDELYWLKALSYKGNIQLDAGVYVWNQEAKSYFESSGYNLSAPYELNQHEWRDLSIQGMEVIVYGRIPMMISANCIYKTYQACEKVVGNRKPTSLIDRYDKKFFVYSNCSNCYNIIYNSSVLALYKQINSLKQQNPSFLRLQFLEEDKEETKKILKGFSAAFCGNAEEADRELIQLEFTNGHYKRGVD